MCRVRPRLPALALPLALLLLAPAAASEPMVVLVDWRGGHFVAGTGNDALDSQAGTSVSGVRVPFALGGCHRTVYLDLLYDPASAGGGADQNSVEVLYEFRAEVWSEGTRLTSKRILHSGYGHALGTLPEGAHELRLTLVVGANVTWSLRLRAWEVPGERACMPPIFINEVEANPAGTDAGREWVELYNPAFEALDVSGWTLRTTHGLTQEHRLPEGSLVPAGGRLVVTFADGQFLDNEDETVELHDGLGFVLDATPVLTDTANDGRTWQRAPDGGEAWAFRAGTQGLANG